MDGTRDHLIKQNKADRKILHIFSHMWNLNLKRMTKALIGYCLKASERWEVEKEGEGEHMIEVCTYEKIIKKPI
jgi:hypothetical protein